MITAPGTLFRMLKNFIVRLINKLNMKESRLVSAHYYDCQSSVLNVAVVAQNSVNDYNVASLFTQT